MLYFFLSLPVISNVVDIAINGKRIINKDKMDLKKIQTTLPLKNKGREERKDLSPFMSADTRILSFIKPFISASFLMI
jgi:hypothetical protein